MCNLSGTRLGTFQSIDKDIASCDAAEGSSGAEKRQLLKFSIYNHLEERRAHGENSYGSCSLRRVVKDTRKGWELDFQHNLGDFLSAIRKEL